MIFGRNNLKDSIQKPRTGPLGLKECREAVKWGKSSGLIKTRALVAGKPPKGKAGKKGGVS